MAENLAGLWDMGRPISPIERLSRNVRQQLSGQTGQQGQPISPTSNDRQPITGSSLLPNLDTWTQPTGGQGLPTDAALQITDPTVGPFVERDPSTFLQFDPFSFTADPGYEYRLAQGRKALEASAAAKGGLFSGATGQALTQFGQDIATGEYQNAYNRYMTERQQKMREQLGLYEALFGLTGLGQTSAAGQAASGQATGANISNLLAGMGQTQAGGTLAQGQTQADFWTTLANLGMSGAGTYNQYQQNQTMQNYLNNGTSYPYNQPYGQSYPARQPVQ